MYGSRRVGGEGAACARRRMAREVACVGRRFEALKQQQARASAALPALLTLCRCELRGEASAVLAGGGEWQSARRLQIESCVHETDSCARAENEKCSEFA